MTAHKTIFQPPLNRLGRELAKDSEEVLGKADWKRLCEFGDGFVDRLTYQLVRFTIEKDSVTRGAENRRWLLSEARRLHELVSEMPGFADELGGVMWSEAHGTDQADWSDLKPDIHPWLSAVLNTTAQILTWQLGETPNVANLDELLTRSKDLRLHDVERNQGFKRKLRSERHLIAELLLAQVDTQKWVVFVSPTRTEHSVRVTPESTSLGPFTQILDGGWPSAWRKLGVELESLDDLFVRHVQSWSSKMALKAKMPERECVRPERRYEVTPSSSAQTWWQDRPEGWAWLGTLNWRSVGAHVERTLESLGALVTLAGTADTEIYFGPVDAFAGLIAFTEDEKPETDAVDAHFDEMWLPLNLDAFLGTLLGTAQVTALGFRRVFCDLHLDMSDNGAARGRLRRALYFWCKGERSRWRLKTQPQSLWTIGDALGAYFSALEIVLGNNDRGSVLQALSTRTAALLSDDAEQRLNDVRRVKRLYELRSAYVHAGQALVRREELLEARAITRICLLDFVRWIASSGSSAEDELDDLRHPEYIRTCDRRSLGG